MTPTRRLQRHRSVATPGTPRPPSVCERARIPVEGERCVVGNWSRDERLQVNQVEEEVWGSLYHTSQTADYNATSPHGRVRGLFSFGYSNVKGPNLNYIRP